MKEVAFFIGSLSTGGAERVVSNLSINLPSYINKKIILFDDKIEYPYKGELMILNKISNNNLLYRFLNLLYRYQQIKKIKKNNVNVPFISFLEHPNLINLLTRKYGPAIISVRNYMSTKHNQGFRALFWNITIKLLYRRADKIIAVSEEIKNNLMKQYKIPEGKINVIYNFYALDEIQQFSKEKIADKYEHIFKCPVVITVGRLNKQKGQQSLIKAFKKVKSTIPDAKLVILGEGNLKDQLKKTSFELGLSKDIHFLGFKSNPFKYIANSKVFVLPSLYEGFPNALAEAMACGVPVISSDCFSGPREILAPAEKDHHNINYHLDKKRYGLLVPVCKELTNQSNVVLTKEEKVLANAIISLLENNELHQYFSNQSLERIQEFGVKEIIKEWENLINK